MTFHPGSLAHLCGAVCNKAPLPSDNCSAAFAHINAWIQDCLQNHKDCKYTISNIHVDEMNGPKLPTRVLDLGCADNTDLSLIETQGERGNYCALSYCWGPPGMNHLLTTRANISSHLDCIRFGQLPKTLQDAVIVTRQISIRYLWIDSLCIIQGDKADWTRESAKMGDVYQKAYLVIAASGATHPGEGCFSNKRRYSTSVKVPHFSEAGHDMGSIRISTCAPGDESPFWGALQKRGWALQERRLARRMLNFMPLGISWKCRELESGERDYYDMQQYSGWDYILEEFSKCQLTYKEDRLVALEGLGKAVQEASGDEYTFGIFMSQLPGLLFWHTKHDEVCTSEDIVSLPTWCWASKGGTKLFLDPSFQLGRSLIDRAKLAVEISGVLRIEGVLQECKVSRTKIDKPKLASLFPEANTCLEDRKTLHLFERTSTSLGFTGIAAFDREHFETVNFLFLSELRHSGKVRPEQVCLINFKTINEN
jgi:hypothetical protein